MELWPRCELYVTVSDLIESFCQAWGQGVKIKIQSSKVKESDFLFIDSSRSRLNLRWKQKLDFRQSIDWTSEWYKASDPDIMTKNQIHRFLEL